ncbi:Hsp20/alpha crystallin family protein [Pontiella sp.]|uniref:Hsp20/alpha crystallin family protein n=1 Tax=Pontiella sp. TaxID=2837462 RepID=UPI00356A6260
MKDKLIPWKRQNAFPQRWRDEDPFEMLHREINDLFDLYYHGERGRRRAGSPGFELSETDDEIRVRAELPGVDEKDIAVELEDHMLVIRGERQEEKETKKRNYHVSEMSYGGYRQSIPLPAEVDRDQAKAKFKRGVLTLTLPKTKQAQAARKRIPVSEG